MLVLDFNSVFSFILLFGFGESQDDLIGGIGPLLAPWLSGEIFGALFDFRELENMFNLSS